MIDWILHRPPHASNPSEIRVAERLTGLADSPHAWTVKRDRMRRAWAAGVIFHADRPRRDLIVTTLADDRFHPRSVGHARLVTPRLLLSWHDDPIKTGDTENKAFDGFWYVGQRCF